MLCCAASAAASNTDRQLLPSRWTGAHGAWQGGSDAVPERGLQGECASQASLREALTAACSQLCPQLAASPSTATHIVGPLTSTHIHSYWWSHLLRCHRCSTSLRDWGRQSVPALVRPVHTASLLCSCSSYSACCCASLPLCGAWPRLPRHFCLNPTPLPPSQPLAQTRRTLIWQERPTGGWRRAVGCPPCR